MIDSCDRGYVLSVCSISVLLIFISACSSLRIYSDDSAKRIETIQSYSEEIVSFENRLDSLEIEEKKIGRRELKVSFPDGSSMKFVWIPPTPSREWKMISAGKDYYLMGDNREDSSPIRFVKLNYGFFIAKAEVNQNQWMQLMNYNPSKNKNMCGQDHERCPVDTVSWTESMQFIREFSTTYSIKFFDKIRRILFFNDYVFRLPTEAEWEYASRAGMYKPTAKYLEETTWSRRASRNSQPVATKQPNPWGIYDMLGNVFEITSDCWPTEDDIKFGDQNTIRVNPVGLPNAVNSRGGAWYSREHVENFGWRANCYHPSYKGGHLGFRLVLAPPLSELNRAPDPRPKPESSLMNAQERQLHKVSEKDCSDTLKIDEVYVIREFNEHILLKVCYEYSGKGTTNLSALTYLNDTNTGKWGYIPGAVQPGTRCTEMTISKSSIFAYTSDAIKITPYSSDCEVTYEFEKYWTDGTDQRRKKLN